MQQGVRKGCVFPPDLLDLYSEMILCEIKDVHSIIVGGQNIINLRYADDTAVISSNQTGYKLSLKTWYARLKTEDYQLI